MNVSKKLLGATAFAVVVSAPAFAQNIIQLTNPTNVAFTYDYDPGKGTNNVTVFDAALTSQMILNQTGGFDYDAPVMSVDTLFGNVPFITYSSRNNSTQALQVGTNNLNVVSPGQITGDFNIFQGAGNYYNPYFDGGKFVYGSNISAIVNVNGLFSNNALLSSNIVTGSQIGQVNVNVINSKTGTATGSIWQQAGTDGSFLFVQENGFSGPTLSVDNMMVAVTANGVSEVRGMSLDPNAETPTFIAGGQQAALVNLNSIAFELSAGATLSFPGDLGTLGVKQDLTGMNSIAVRNLAAAISLYNGDALVDPAVMDIEQTSYAAINTMRFTTPVSGVSDGVNQYSSATVELNGWQNAIPYLNGSGVPYWDGGYDPIFPNDAITYVRLGNVAAAIGGVPFVGESFYYTGNLNDPYAWLDNLGAGTAVISNVNQVAALQLNTISNPVGSDSKDQGAAGGINLNLSGPRNIESLSDPLAPQSAFFQLFAGGSLEIVPVEFGGTPVVNLLVAGVAEGTATITNSSQAFLLNINSVEVGGSLSGGLVQHAYDVGKSGPVPFINAAVAVSYGNAKIDGLTQVMQQSYNSVSAGNLNDLYLNQFATDVNLGNQNVAVVQSWDGSATLKGLVQVSSLNVNTISAGTLTTGSGVITQSVRGIDSLGANLAVMNTTQVSGVTTAVQGLIQQATTSINTITAK